MSRKAKEIYEAVGKVLSRGRLHQIKAGAVVPLVGIPQMSDKEVAESRCKKRNRQLRQGARKAPGIA